MLTIYKVASLGTWSSWEWGGDGGIVGVEQRSGEFGYELGYRLQTSTDYSANRVSQDLTPPTPADDAMAEWSLCLTLDALASEFLPATDAGTAEERQFAEDLAKVQQQAEEQATLALPEEWYPWEAQY